MQAGSKEGSEEGQPAGSKPNKHGSLKWSSRPPPARPWMKWDTSEQPDFFETPLAPQLGIHGLGMAPAPYPGVAPVHTLNLDEQEQQLAHQQIAQLLLQQKGGPVKPHKHADGMTAVHHKPASCWVPEGSSLPANQRSTSPGPADSGRGGIKRKLNADVTGSHISLNGDTTGTATAQLHAPAMRGGAGLQPQASQQPAAPCADSATAARPSPRLPVNPGQLQQLLMALARAAAAARAPAKPEAAETAPAEEVPVVERLGQLLVRLQHDRQARQHQQQQHAVCGRATATGGVPAAVPREPPPAAAAAEPAAAERSSGSKRCAADAGLFVLPDPKLLKASKQAGPHNSSIQPDAAAAAPPAVAAATLPADMQVDSGEQHSDAAGGQPDAVAAAATLPAAYNAPVGADASRSGNPGLACKQAADGPFGTAGSAAPVQQADATAGHTSKTMANVSSTDGGSGGVSANGVADVVRSRPPVMQLPLGMRVAYLRAAGFLLPLAELQAQLNLQQGADLATLPVGSTTGGTGKRNSKHVAASAVGSKKKPPAAPRAPRVARPPPVAAYVGGNGKMVGWEDRTYSVGTDRHRVWEEHKLVLRVLDMALAAQPAGLAAAQQATDVFKGRSCIVCWRARPISGSWYCTRPSCYKAAGAAAGKDEEAVLRRNWALVKDVTAQVKAEAGQAAAAAAAAAPAAEAALDGEAAAAAAAAAACNDAAAEAPAAAAEVAPGVAGAPAAAGEMATEGVPAAAGSAAVKKAAVNSVEQPGLAMNGTAAALNIAADTAAVGAGEKSPIHSVSSHDDRLAATGAATDAGPCQLAASGGSSSDSGVAKAGEPEKPAGCTADNAAAEAGGEPMMVDAAAAAAADAACNTAATSLDVRGTPAAMPAASGPRATAAASDLDVDMPGADGTDVAAAADTSRRSTNGGLATGLPAGKALPEAAADTDTACGFDGGVVAAVHAADGAGDVVVADAAADVQTPADADCVVLSAGSPTVKEEATVQAGDEQKQELQAVQQSPDSQQQQQQQTLGQEMQQQQQHKAVHGRNSSCTLAGEVLEAADAAVADVKAPAADAAVPAAPAAAVIEDQAATATSPAADGSNAVVAPSAAAATSMGPAALAALASSSAAAAAAAPPAAATGSQAMPLPGWVLPDKEYKYPDLKRLWGEHQLNLKVMLMELEHQPQALAVAQQTIDRMFYRPCIRCFSEGEGRAKCSNGSWFCATCIRMYGKAHSITDQVGLWALTHRVSVDPTYKRSSRSPWP